MYIEIPLWQYERHSRYTRLVSDDKTREISKELNYSPNQSLVTGELQKFPNKFEDLYIGQIATNQYLSRNARRFRQLTGVYLRRQETEG